MRNSGWIQMLLASNLGYKGMEVEGEYTLLQSFSRRINTRHHQHCQLSINVAEKIEEKHQKGYGRHRSRTENRRCLFLLQKTHKWAKLKLLRLQDQVNWQVNLR